MIAPSESHQSALDESNLICGKQRTRARIITLANETDVQSTGFSRVFAAFSCVRLQRPEDPTEVGTLNASVRARAGLRLDAAPAKPCYPYARILDQVCVASEDQ